jgi:hypothetical protein
MNSLPCPGTAKLTSREGVAGASALAVMHYLLAHNLFPHLSIASVAARGDVSARNPAEQQLLRSRLAVSHLELTRRPLMTRDVRREFPRNFTPAELTIFQAGVSAATGLHLE